MNYNIWVQVSETFWTYNTGWFEITLERASNHQEDYWILKSTDVGVSYDVQFCQPDSELVFAQERALATVKRHLERCYQSL